MPDIGQVRGTQRRFSENICSEDDLSSRIFGTFVVKLKGLIKGLCHDSAHM